MVKLDLTSEHHLHETLKKKLKSGEEVTWGDVVIALHTAGEDDLAQQVALAHSSGSLWTSYKLMLVIDYYHS